MTEATVYITLGVQVGLPNVTELSMQIIQMHQRLLPEKDFSGHRQMGPEPRRILWSPDLPRWQTTAYPHCHFQLPNQNPSYWGDVIVVEFG